MAKSMDIPVIGLVENYSYVICPDCGKEFKIFGESGLDKLAEELDLPILGRMPIDPKLAELASGEFAKANNEYLAAADTRNVIFFKKILNCILRPEITRHSG